MAGGRKNWGINLKAAIKIVMATLLVLALVFILSQLQACVFCGTTLTPAPCVATPGFNCSDSAVSTMGNFSATIAQDRGRIYNVEFACVAIYNDSSIFPNTTTTITFTNMSSLTLPKTQNNTFLSDQKVNITGLQCYGANNKPFNNDGAGYPPGTVYNGYLLISYTNGAGTPSGFNPWLAEPAAEISVRVR